MFPAICSCPGIRCQLCQHFCGQRVSLCCSISSLLLVRQCLFNTTIASDATASASASAAATAIAQADASAASNVITGALCDPVTASATAQAFAQAIATGQGCNGVIQQAISSKCFCCVLAPRQALRLPWCEWVYRLCACMPYI